MKTRSAKLNSLATIGAICAAVWACLPASLLVAQQPATNAPAPKAQPAPPTNVKTFETPQKGAEALIRAAESFDVAALTQIFGPDGNDIVMSGEVAQDRKHATDFAAQARAKNSVSMDPRTRARAFLLVGDEEWPFPVPLVQRAGKWFFDSKAGKQELLYRRIGANELDAIDICRGYVEAQHEYAMRQRATGQVSQYAQRIVSSAGKQDGLAWQNPDGAWDGPIGENIARAIDQGYTTASEPYHGYFFKILKGQGPAAPLGEIDFVINGVMIGGFALVAAPAEYNVTGVRTFVVSHDGIVYEKDLGPTTLDEFKRMDRFNPDKTWAPVAEHPE